VPVAAPWWDGRVLTARRSSAWRSRWEVARDGVPLLTLDGSTWSGGGHFELAGRRYDIPTNWLGSRYRLESDGAVVAEAERVGRKDWTLTADGRTHRFRRRSIWRPDQEMVDESGAVLGGVRRTGTWNRGAEADLPGLAEPVAVFVLGVVLLSWEQAAAAAAAT